MPQSGTWNVDANGNWSLNTNWVSNTIADGATYTANITKAILASRTVTVNTARTIGNLVFSDGGLSGDTWFVAGSAGNALTLDNGASQPTVVVNTRTIVTSAVAGTNGFVKSGAQELEFGNTTYTSTITGEIKVNGAGGTPAYLGMGVYSATGGASVYSTTNVFPGTGGSVPTINVVSPGVSNGDWVRIWHAGAAQTISNQFIGNGAVDINYKTDSASGQLTFAAGAFAGLTGVSTTTPTPDRGLCLTTINSGFYEGAVTVNVNDLPSGLSFRNLRQTGAGGAAATFTVNYLGTSGTAWPTSIRYGAGDTTANTTAILSASQAAGSALILQGGVTRPSGDSVGGTFTFRLTGTNTDNNEIRGVISNITTAFQKQGTGRWILSGANTYAVATSVSAGTLSAQNASAFGAAASAVTQTGGTIEVAGGTALNKTGATLTLISVSGATALSAPSGANSIDCAGVTLSSTSIVDVGSGASLTLNNTAAMSGAYGITKNGDGEFILGTFANTYTNAVTINAGTLTVSTLAPAGSSSSLGTGAATPAIALSGTLKFVGNTIGQSTTNRSITFTGASPALDASGGTWVTYSACTQAAGARTITFTGSSTAGNTLSAALSDGTGAVSIAKSGAGKWVLSNATVNYTGTTTVSDGTLNFGSANRSLTGNVLISGGTIENSTRTLSANVTMTGGTITAQLTGNKTLTVNSGSDATLNPTNAANSFTGATTVNSGGVLKLVTSADPISGGRVLGDSAVTVAGTLKTSAAGSQAGKMRYGTGGLTFNTGATLRIGGA